MNAVAGLGPVGLLVAALLRRSEESFVFWARPSERSRKVASALESGIVLDSSNACPELHQIAIRGEVDFSDTPRPVENLYLCIPHTEYLPYLQSLPAGSYKNLILLNSALGTGRALTPTLPKGTTLRGFSNFFGAAKMREEQLHLKALKKRVFLSGEEHLPLASALQSLGVKVTNVSHQLESEIRNITLYAHTALGLAPQTLETVLGLTETPRYLYKLYPEGPIERDRTKLYAAFFQDVMTVAEQLGAEPFNLLAFLHRDNYPVPAGFLADEEVDNFPNLSLQQQGDLLFARYAGLLVDANSVPDENGRFFDFSAVPVAKAVWEDNVVKLPRVQGEELFHLSLLRAWSHELKLTLPAVEQVWNEVQSLASRLQPERSTIFQEFLGEQQERAKSISAKGLTTA